MTPIMTPDHPQWEIFIERLTGAEGCNFKEDAEKGYTWKCNGGTDKSYAEAILKTMAVDAAGSLAYFETQGGYCDCEIVFNVNDR